MLHKRNIYATGEIYDGGFLVLHNLSFGCPFAARMLSSSSATGAGGLLLVGQWYFRLTGLLSEVGATSKMSP
jgi:hypothetical protein